MPRYIDADALIKKIFPYDLVDEKCYSINAKAVHEEIKKAPTADVILRSELAVHSVQDAATILNLQESNKKLEAEVERLKHILDSYALQYGTVKEQQDVIDKANQEFASEIFGKIKEKISSMHYNANTTRKTVKVEELKEQVDWVLHEVMPNVIAEIEKKYTEGEE